MCDEMTTGEDFRSSYSFYPSPDSGQALLLTSPGDEFGQELVQAVAIICILLEFIVVGEPP